MSARSAKRKRRAAEALAGPMPGPKPGPEPAARQLPLPGFYDDTYSQEERSRMSERIEAETLVEEIWMQRVVNLRLLRTYLQCDGDEPKQVELRIRIARTLIAGAGRVAELMRTRRALLGDSADGLNAAIATVLDEVSTQLGLPL